MQVDAGSVDEFVLRMRSLNALRRAGIATVGQLAALPKRELLVVSGLGVKGVADLSRALADRSLDGRDPLARLARPRPLSGRDREILRMRASGATLVEIANRFGISRERVCQLLARDGPEGV